MRSVGDMIKRRRKELKLTQLELAKKLDVSSSAISRYESGEISAMGIDKALALAKALNISPVDLIHALDRDVDNRIKYLSNGNESMDIFTSDFGDVVVEPNILHGPKTKIKIYGSIPAGAPIEAWEEDGDELEIPQSWLLGGKEYFALRVKGDSMYPKYFNGDVVVVQLQPDCESGQDCAVYVNGYDATLKTVRKNMDGSLTLEPYNRAYPPQTYHDDVKILGVVKELRRKV